MGIIDLCHHIKLSNICVIGKLESEEMYEVKTTENGPKGLKILTHISKKFQEHQAGSKQDKHQEKNVGTSQ